MNRELEVLDFIDSIPDGGIFFDVGACEGRFAIYAALSGIVVYAFEPEARNYQSLLTNIGLNTVSGKNLIASALALSDISGTTTMNIGQPWAGGHHKQLAHGPGRKDMNFDILDSQQIDVARLDDLRHLPRPGYLKIDVDGSEKPFLDGASETLADKALKGIMIELLVNDPLFDTLYHVITSNGFVEKSRHLIEADLYNIWFVR